MNDLEYKQNRIEAYWRRQKAKSPFPLDRAEFERRIQSMKDDLPAEQIEEMYNEILQEDDKG